MSRPCPCTSVFNPPLYKPLYTAIILGDPGVDSAGGEGKSKQAENMAWRKVKNGEKSPWGQCLTRPVPNGRHRSDFWLVPENFCVFLPNQKSERRWPFGTGPVRHCPQGLFSLFFTFLCAIFSARLLDFPSPPALSAPGSPTMHGNGVVWPFCQVRTWVYMALNTSQKIAFLLSIET